jgi:hypothetical protein
LVEDDNNDDGDIGNQYEDMNEECNKKIGLHNEANVGLFNEDRASSFSSDRNQRDSTS